MVREGRVCVLRVEIGVKSWLGKVFCIYEVKNYLEVWEKMDGGCRTLGY